MSDVMSFPKTIDDFLRLYSFKDKEEAYTNGSYLIPLFRVEQGLNHYYGTDSTLDYKERFKIEYKELNERITKLKSMLDKYKKGTLDFTPTCPIFILEEQLNHMKSYKNILAIRADMEKIDLGSEC